MKRRVVVAVWVCLVAVLAGCGGGGGGVGDTTPPVIGAHTFSRQADTNEAVVQVTSARRG